MPTPLPDVVEPVGLAPSIARIDGILLGQVQRVAVRDLLSEREPVADGDNGAGAGVDLAAEDDVVERAANGLALEARERGSHRELDGLILDPQPGGRASPDRHGGE